MNTARRTNPGYRKPSPDVLRKLELSRQEAEKIEKREMHCPMCGYLVQIIPVTQTDVVFAKCQKCKFVGPLSPVYFRRMKRYRTGLATMSRRQSR